MLNIFTSLTKSWKFWIVVVIIVVGVIYLFEGGKRHYEVTGFRTLKDYCDYRQQLLTGLESELADLYTVPQFVPPAPNVNLEWRSFKSKGESLCCRAIESLLGRSVQVNVRNLGIVNPETRRQLEIDCYDPQSQIGIEYNGIQHYVYPNSFHKTRQDFDAQVRRDQYKTQFCEQRGIRLIVVPYVIDTCVPTAEGFRHRKHSDAERYQRIYDFLHHTLHSSGEHYTTHFGVA